MSAGVEPGTHVRGDGERLDPGVYRVVGRREGRVTLLRVGNEAGERVHTGEIHRLERSAFDSLTRTDPPSAGLGGVARAAADALWFSVRAIPGNLRARPVQVGLGVALLLAAALRPELPGPAVFELLGTVLLATAAVGLPR